MKRIFVAVALMATSNAFAFDINAYCRHIGKTHGGGYHVEGSCRHMELEARATLLLRAIPTRIENHCREIGEAAGGSYQIMNACVYQELNARARLQ